MSKIKSLMGVKIYCEAFYTVDFDNIPDGMETQKELIEYVKDKFFESKVTTLEFVGDEEPDEAIDEESSFLNACIIGENDEVISFADLPYEKNADEREDTNSYYSTPFLADKEEIHAEISSVVPSNTVYKAVYTYTIGKDKDGNRLFADVVCMIINGRTIAYMGNESNAYYSNTNVTLLVSVAEEVKAKIEALAKEQVLRDFENL